MREQEKKRILHQHDQGARRSAAQPSPYADIKQLASVAGNSAMEALLRQKTSSSSQGSGQPLPDSLRNRFEAAAGVPLDDVRVHYNSPEPIPFMARAFTRGSDIHIAPGQEDTLEHEVTHAVQQKQGRVQATGEVNGVPVNEDKGLEGEAENQMTHLEPCQSVNSSSNNPMQRFRVDDQIVNLATYLQNAGNNYNEYARLYHEAMFPGQGQFTYNGRQFLIDDEEKQQILMAYQRLAPQFGPILRDRDGDGQEGALMQYGNAAINQKIVFTGLDSCMGITLIKQNGEKFGVHLVLPIEERLIEIYADRLNKLAAYRDSATEENPINKTIVSAKGGGGGVATHITALSGINNNLNTRLEELLGECLEDKESLHYEASTDGIASV